MNDHDTQIHFTDQQKKALDLQRNLVITAGAGSGKTTILVERYFRILLADPHSTLHNILAVTFTEKAASEMRQRIVEKIYQHFQNESKWRERLFETIKNISEIQISTIHAFCQRLLKENFLKIQLNPDFRIAMQPEIDEMLNRTFWRFFYSYRPDSQKDLDLVLTALRELKVDKIKKIFFNTYYYRAAYAPYLQAYSAMSPEELIAEWRKVKKNYYEALLRPLIEDAQLAHSMEVIKRGLLNIRGKTAQKLSSALQNYLSMSSDAYSEKVLGAIELLNALFKKGSEPHQQHVSNAAKCEVTVQSAFNLLVEKSRSLHRAFINEKDNDGSESSHAARVACGLSHLLNRFLVGLEEEKQRQQLLDFDDLLLKTRDLLRNSPEVLHDAQQRYRWILIDEFQDTDAVQNEIITLLCTDQNNVFFVGDPKQSIYSFRQADVSIFQQKLESIQAQPAAAVPFVDAATNRILFSTATENKGVIELPHNFRSSRGLIDFYNYLFEKVFERESTYEPAAEFEVPFKPLSPPPDRMRDEIPSRIELRLINYDNVNKDQYVEFEIYHIIEIIKSIVGKQKKYDHRTSKWENVAYGDIAILVRDRRQWQKISHALQVAEIPFEIYQGAGFFQTREVQDIYYLLKAIADPQDNFAFIASLRSPYIGVSDAGLFYLSRCKGGNYGERLQRIHTYLQGAEIESCFQEDFAAFLNSNNNHPGINPDDQQALTWAAELFPRWHLSLHRGEYSLILNEIIGTFNISAILQSGEFGRQKIANLNKLLQFTYDFEQKSSGRVTDFLDVFRGLMQGTIQEGEAAMYFEGGDRVTLLTIHGAKGLEFPVVIMPFLESEFKFDEDIYHHKDTGMFVQFQNKSKTKSFIGNYFFEMKRLQTIAEEKRLLYVAATRAKDHLFFIGANPASKSTRDNYLDFLLRALEIDPIERQPIENKLKEQFGFQVFRQAVDENTPDPTFHKVEARSESTKEEKIPNREMLARYFQRLQPPIEYGEYSVTQLMIYEESPERYIHYHYFKNGIIYPPHLVEEYSDEPGGLWWGTLVHRALEHFHKRTAAEDGVLVEKLINQFRIPEDEVARLQPELLKLLDRFRSTSIAKHLLHCEQQSEVRLVRQLPCGVLSGILDRIFKNEKGIWEALDFKTNHITKAELPSLIEKYSSQLSYYAMLLSDVFPQQRVYPVRLYFLSIDEEYRREFTAEEIARIAPKAEATIRGIQKVEEAFFGIGQESNTEGH